MDLKDVFKQQAEFYKTTFDNGFSAVSLVQDQMQKMTQSVMDHASWIPEEGRKAVEDMTDSYKAGRDQFKEYVDASYQKVEKYMAGS